MLIFFRFKKILIYFLILFFFFFWWAFLHKQQACFYASSRGAIDVVSYLITLGVSPTSSKADPDLQHGRNCFFVAVAAQQRKLVRYFIQDLKIDPNVPGTL